MTCEICCDCGQSVKLEKLDLHICKSNLDYLATLGKTEFILSVCKSMNIPIMIFEESNSLDISCLK
tara:strand:- start:295 stop:492 length:198 start_codon:yes stop_codon:yes gene_type:complete